jgi:hypothetical protein
MESAQVIAAFVAGLVIPFVQEILFGAKVSGRAAVVLTVGTTFVIATVASWMTGGFAGANAAPAFNFIDPSAFFGFWWKLWAPVYVISQFVYGLTTKHGAESPPATGPIQSIADKVQPVIGTN